MVAHSRCSQPSHWALQLPHHRRCQSSRRLWGEADSICSLRDFRLLTPNVWSGRASQEVFVDLVASGLASMYPPFIGARRLLAIMDISALAILLADRPRVGHLGHQCSHAPGRPNLHLVSSSRRPRRAMSSHPPSKRSGSTDWGGCVHDRPRLEVPAVSQNAPGNAGELIGERNGKHVVMQPLLGRLEPGPEPMAFPAL